MWTFGFIYYYACVYFLLGDFLLVRLASSSLAFYSAVSPGRLSASVPLWWVLGLLDPKCAKNPLLIRGEILQHQRSRPRRQLRPGSLTGSFGGLCLQWRPRVLP